MTHTYLFAAVVLLGGAGIVPMPSAGLSPQAQAASKTLNLYTARHYSSDEALYTQFTAKTGIKINLVSANDEPLLERIRSEGAASPADVILLADATRLWRAEQEGLLQPLQSPLLAKVIPADRRGSDLWVGLTTRARVMVIDPTKIKPEQVSTYAALSDPALKGQVCSRSASHPYMLSLIGAQIAKHGPAKAEAWMRGVMANLARPSKAETPTRSGPSPQASAALRSPTVTTMPGSCAATSPRTRLLLPRQPLSGRTKRVTAPM